jgi:hypothetical protein
MKLEMPTSRKWAARGREWWGLGVRRRSGTGFRRKRPRASRIRPAFQYPTDYFRQIITCVPSSSQYKLETFAICAAQKECHHGSLHVSFAKRTDDAYSTQHLNMYFSLGTNQTTSNRLILFSQNKSASAISQID